MKLIDLLVRELPGEGGWPLCHSYIAQDGNAVVCSYEYKPELQHCAYATSSEYDCKIILFGELSDDWNTAVITRDQYEAALAAASKPLWAGEGFPPVGSKVKVWNDEASTYQKGLVVYSSHKGATVDVGYLFSSGEQGDFSLLTSEDRAEELAINAILYQTEIPTKSAGELYYLIKHGKIPGVRLDDEAGR